jgi:hypothetical protein
VTACLNCQAPLADAQRFCGFCGQRVVHGRLTLGEITHDLVHALTHADRSIFSLIGALLSRPGRVARDYIEGRRKRYFGPFAFLVISVGVTSFVTYLAGLQWFESVPQDQARALLTRHFNLVILIQMPLLAFGCWLLFRDARLNFSEHLVLAAYVSGIRALFLAFVETPMRYWWGSESGHWSTWIYFGAWFAYFAFAATQFYRGHWAWTALRAILAAILSVGFMSMIIYAFMVLMVRLGGF